MTAPQRPVRHGADDADHPLVPLVERPLLVAGLQYVLLVYPERCVGGDPASAYVPCVVATSHALAPSAGYVATAVVTRRDAYVLECPAHIRAALAAVLRGESLRIRVEAKQ